MRVDKQEFTRRVLAMEGRLYRVSRGILRDSQDQLDAVQDAVMSAWVNVGKLRKREYFETWLTRILINKCYDVIKARRRLVPLEEVPERAAPEGANAELYDAIEALSEEYRLPIVLHYMEGYKLREIADILELPMGTVKTRLLRGKKRLREQLEEGDRA